MMVSNFIQNIYFSPQTLQPIYIEYKSSCLSFLISGLWKEREKSLKFSNRERKSTLSPILAVKIVDLGVKGGFIYVFFNLEMF
jgi:hypothetical protein